MRVVLNKKKRAGSAYYLPIGKRGKRVTGGDYTVKFTRVTRGINMKREGKHFMERGRT